MFQLNPSPCVFEPLPAYNAAPSVYYYPEHKKRRLQNCPFVTRALPVRRETVKHQIDENDKEYVLSLYKTVSEEKVSKAVYERLQEVRDNYAPKYQLVRDYFGNEFYIKEDKDEDAIIQEAIAQLDMTQIGRQLAKQAFQDYEITLNHTGDELAVVSQHDRYEKIFALGSECEDVRVIGCEMISDSVARLKVGVQKPARAEPVTFATPIQFQILVPTQQQQESQESNSESDSQEIEDALQAKQRRELQKKERKEARRVQKRQERARRNEERRQQEAVLEQEQQRLAEEARVAEERRRLEVQAAAEEERQRRAYLEAKQRAREIAEAEEKEKKIAEMKQRLIAEKRNRRLQQQSEQPSEASEPERKSPNNVVININFGTPENVPGREDQNGKARDQPKRSRSRSPVVLEDVEDEETNRYQQSLTRSPRGSSVIDDL